MEIVPEIFEKVERAGSRLVLVTKYLNAEDTRAILENVHYSPRCAPSQPVVCNFWGVGENRMDQILEKNLPREMVHFLGNIQSRKISEIAKTCSVIHSLCSLEHANLFSRQPMPPSVFVQVNISRAPQKQGIFPEDLGDFVTELKKLPIEILGISALGAEEFTRSEKQAEFRRLKILRDQFLPGKKISAGTSLDFEIALEEGIEVVRIGRACFRF